MSYEIFKQPDHRKKGVSRREECEKMLSYLKDNPDHSAKIDMRQSDIRGWSYRLGYKVHTSKLDSVYTLVWSK